MSCNTNDSSKRNTISKQIFFTPRLSSAISELFDVTLSHLMTWANSSQMQSFKGFKSGLRGAESALKMKNFPVRQKYFQKKSPKGKMFSSRETFFPRKKKKFFKNFPQIHKFSKISPYGRTRTRVDSAPLSGLFAGHVSLSRNLWNTILASLGEYVVFRCLVGRFSCFRIVEQQAVLSWCNDDDRECLFQTEQGVLYSKCSPSNIRRNETNDQHSFLVQWLIRLPGKQEVHGSIPCEGRVLFFCSVLWSCHHVAISVIRTRETITSERIITRGATLSEHTANHTIAFCGNFRCCFFHLSDLLPPY